ncbi:MAG: hypothetical protein JRJ29_13475, partial [Deltaproteobacteria bacterium]|nr:hypothetical protein [Deltaproteobacteria bacterium]
NIIEASWQALADSVQYKLSKRMNADSADGKTKMEKATEKEIDTADDPGKKGNLRGVLSG